MKLWQKGDLENKNHAEIVEKFTVGNDLEFDLLLAASDVKGSLAHAKMLENIGILTKKEYFLIDFELKNILENIEKGDFKIEEGIEDVHSQIEYILTKKIGGIGKKIHTGRSRNDQVLVDLKLFLKKELFEISEHIEILFLEFQKLSEEHKEKLLPGYTHFQLAMPSSFGLWFGAYAEALSDDLEIILSAYKICNKNPLGSGAGYGSSFPINRALTTQLLGFESMNYNVVYAQMTRGKSEKIVAMALANLAGTLSKFAYDVTLYMNQNFGFITFPDSLTTGSSIMPHKKNPDVFELIRAKCNKIQALPNELTLLMNNLPSGYHRDWQLTKESLFPAIKTIKDCMEMTVFMLKNIIVKDEILEDEKYQYLFSVEEVNREVLQGTPFRDAYKKVGNAIESGDFNPEKSVHHSHEGSIGNLCNQEIKTHFYAIKNQIK